MAADPLVSVVIPAYNAERTLGEALDSLLAQTFEGWEALIVDDHSSDGTARVIADYAARDPRFRTATTHGSGAAAARNAGIAAGVGRWLLFLDADDWIASTFLRTMLDALAGESGAVASYCAYRRVMPDGQEGPVRSAARLAEQPLQAFAWSCAVAIHAVLVERQAVVDVGGMDPGLRTCEDWDLWQRIARLGRRWVQVDEALAFYRVSASSLSREVEGMIGDAKRVIERGFGPDPRVPDADAELATGASASGNRPPELALAWFALWVAAQDCGMGRDGEVDPALLRPLPSDSGSTRAIVEVIVDAVMVGVGCVYAQLAENWPRFGAALTALIERLGDLWDDPVAARRLQYRLEDEVLAYDDLREPRSLALTLGLRVELARPRDTALPPGIDRIYAYLDAEGETQSIALLGVLGTVTAGEWAELQIKYFGADWAMSRIVPGLGKRWDRAVLRYRLGKLRRRPWRVRRALQDSVDPVAAQQMMFDEVGVSRAEGSHTERLEAMRSEALAWAKTQAVDNASDDFTPRAPDEPSRSGDRQTFWDTLFDVEDPWNYNSAYEVEKYGRQIAMLPEGTIGHALELACAEGHFTVDLANRVNDLLATDISSKAVERAAARIGQAPHVRFAKLDLSADPIPGGMDLIFCSEVLYYLRDESELRTIAARIAAALKPGGSLVSAHAFVLKDDLSQTGFDWENPFGADVIARVLAETPGLSLDRSLQTELYRIDRFRRVEDDAARAPPEIEHAAITASIAPEVRRQIIWGGAAARRAEVANEVRSIVPALMYHAIADDGPEELQRYRTSTNNFRKQIHWLRRNGYHAIGCEQVEWFIRNQHPFTGRPVVISFDDGLQSFADQAWPILQDYDFVAEMFIVTDHVGGAAEWDREFGAPAPLMDAATITRLSKEGMLFGSHLESHRAVDGLATMDLFRELTRSRAILGEWLGRAPISFAAPFSIIDKRFNRLAEEAGYTVGFGDGVGVLGLTADTMNLPRIEVRGDWSLDTFVQTLEACR